MPHFSIKVRMRRWLSRWYHVGAACRLLCYCQLARFVLWPRNLCSTAQAQTCSGQLLCGSPNSWWTVVFWSALLHHFSLRKHSLTPSISHIGWSSMRVRLSKCLSSGRICCSKVGFHMWENGVHRNTLTFLSYCSSDNF